MDPFHGVQPFRDRLLQCESPWAAASARNLLLPGLSMGYRFLQGMYTCYNTAAGWLSAAARSSMGCWGTTGSTMVFSTGCSKILTLVPTALPPPPSPPVLVSACLFFSLLSQLMHHVFYPFLNMLPQRCHQLCWWTELCPVVGSFWSWQEPAGSDVGQPLSLLIEANPTAPCYQNLAM